MERQKVAALATRAATERRRTGLHRVRSDSALYKLALRSRLARWRELAQMPACCVPAFALRVATAFAAAALWSRSWCWCALVVAWTEDR